jgi:hypothetical protein
VIAKCSAQDSSKERFAKTLETVVFNMKKLLNDGVDPRSCGFPPRIAGYHLQTGQRRPPLRTYETACGPLGTENVSWQKIGLSADSAPDHPAVVGGILDSGWLLAGLEPAGLLYLAQSAGKIPGNA